MKNRAQRGTVAVPEKLPSAVFGTLKLNAATCPWTDTTSGVVRTIAVTGAPTRTGTGVIVTSRIAG
jgi:hypothetical protein